MNRPWHQRIAFLKPHCPISVKLVQWPAVVPDAACPLAHHREVEFQLIKEGRGAYLIDDRRYRFEPNTLIVIPPNRIHRIIPAPGTRNVRLSLFFAKEWLPKGRAGRRWLTDISRRIALTPTEAATLDLLLRRLKSEIEGEASGGEALARLFLREFLMLVRRAADRLDTPREADHPLLHEVIGFINTHFAEPVDRRALARRAGFSPGHLTRIFKRHTGLGIKQYILHRRVLEARRLLEESPALSVSAISQQVGFRDCVPFYRAFKVIANATPAEYRALARRQNRRT